jgi:hypothetical protein
VWPGAPPFAAPQAYVSPYYFPQATVRPPATLPFEEGDTVPAGYQLKTRRIKSMLVAGSVTFSVSYFLSILSGSVLVATNKQGSGFAPLFAPVVGPLVTIGTGHANAATALWLALDGIAQTAGAVTLIYSLLAEEKYLEFENRTATSWRPELLVGPGSAAARWTF